MWKIDFSLASGDMLAQTQEGSCLADDTHLGWETVLSWKCFFAHKKTWHLPKNIRQQFRFIKFMYQTLITCKAALMGILLLVLPSQEKVGWKCPSRLSRWHFWFLLADFVIWCVAGLWSWGTSFSCGFRVQWTDTQAGEDSASKFGNAA